MTRKDLNLPIRRFDPHTTEKTIQPLTLPVVVYDDQALTWLKGATLTEEQLKKSINITQSVDDPSAARIEFNHPRSFNDELLGTSFNPGESPVSSLPKTAMASAMGRSSCRQRRIRSTRYAATSPMI